MKTGLVLSGGGARGVAHLGVIKALKEQQIEIERISGTSAGAVAGALFAYGYSPDEILNMILKSKLLDFFRPGFRSKGLIRLNKAADKLHGFLPDNLFEKLKIPLTVNATDLSNGKITYFDQGELVLPILASCAIPVIFDPIEIKKRLYADGGLMNNFAIEPLENNCTHILGVNTNPINENLPLDGIMRVAERTFDLATLHHAQSKKDRCDIYIEDGRFLDFGIFDIAKAKDIFKAGYDACKDRMTEIESKLNKR